MKDFFIGLGFIIGGVVTIITAQSFPTIPSLQYGPSLFPSLVGGGFCIGGAVLAISNLQNIRGFLSSASHNGQSAVLTGRKKRFLISLLPPLLILFYIMASDYIGAATVMALIMLLLMLVRRTPLWVALVTSVVVALVINFIFSQYLLIPLPKGSLIEGGLLWML